MELTKFERELELEMCSSALLLQMKNGDAETLSNSDKVHLKPKCDLYLYLFTVENKYLF